MLCHFDIQPQHSYDTDRERQAGWSEPVSYPLGHVGQSRSADRVQDRGRNQNRNHNRNTSRPGDSRGHTNEGPGILGAKPGDRLVPDISSLSGWILLCVSSLVFYMLGFCWLPSSVSGAQPYFSALRQDALPHNKSVLSSTALFS